MSIQSITSYLKTSIGQPLNDAKKLIYKLVCNDSRVRDLVRCFFADLALYTAKQALDTFFVQEENSEKMKIANIGKIAIVSAVIVTQSYKFRTLHCLIKAELYEKNYCIRPEEVKKGEQIALFFKGYFPQIVLNLTPEARVKSFNKLNKRYKIVVQNAFSVDKMEHIIKEITKRGAKIRLIWIAAHGNADRIALSPSAYLTPQKLLSQSLGDTLEQLPPRGAIILESCHTGSDHSYGIAGCFAATMNDWKVFAPTSGLAYDGTVIESIDPIVVRQYGCATSLNSADKLQTKEIGRVFEKTLNPETGITEITYRTVNHPQ